MTFQYKKLAIKKKWCYNIFGEATTETIDDFTRK